MFKICVIGCGGMSFTGHGPAFKKYFEDYDGVALAACCDINEEAAKQYKEDFGFEAYYTDYTLMLDEVKELSSEEVFGEISRLTGAQDISSQSLSAAKDMKEWSDNFKRAL